MGDLVKPRVVDFRRGMETTREEQNDDIFSWRELLNSRVDRASLRRRKGMVALTKTTTTATSFDMDATNDSVAIGYDARVWALSTIPSWTLEMLVNCDTLSSQRVIFSRNLAAADVKIYMDSTSGGRVVAEIIDSSAVTLTLQVTGVAATTLCAIKLICSNYTSFTLRVNDSTATGSLTAGSTIKVTTATLFMGRDDSGDFFDGKYDFARLFRGVRATVADAYMRLLDPYAPDVLADYVCEADSNNYCLDRSRFGLHASVAGAPATVASIAVNPMPVRGLSYAIDNQGRRRVYFYAGPALYPVTM